MTWQFRGGISESKASGGAGLITIDAFTRSAGDIIILVAGAGTTIGFSAVTGYTLIHDHISAAGSFGVWRRIATNTAADLADIFVSSGTPTMAYSVAAYYEDTRTGERYMASAEATGSSTTPDPPSVAPTTTALVVTTIATEDLASGTAPTAPTNYTRDIEHSTSGRPHTAIARREVSAGTEDPGTWTIAATENWHAVTIVLGFADIAGNQPAPSGTIGKKRLSALAGAQPFASGAVLSKQFKALAGAQPAASGTIAGDFLVVEVGIAGAQPAASGTIRSLQYEALTGAQPAATGAIAAKTLAKFLAGDQPSAAGALALRRLLSLIALAGAQPTATGTIAGATISSSDVAGNQPEPTGALRGVFANKLIAGDQPFATGLLAVDIVLRHISLAGAQAAPSGALITEWINKLIAGNQAAPSGTVDGVKALFITPAGDQPFATGALSQRFAAKSVTGDQPASTGILILLVRLNISGAQGEPSGAVVGLVITVFPVSRWGRLQSGLASMGEELERGTSLSVPPLQPGLAWPAQPLQPGSRGL